MANQNYYGQPNNKKDNGTEIVSWIIIGACFLVGIWPVGVFLLISKLRENNKSQKKRPTVDVKTAHQSRNVYQQPQQQTQQTRQQQVYQQPYQQVYQQPQHQNVAQKLTRTPVPTPKKSNWMQIVGIIVAVIFGIAAMSTASEIIGSLIAGWEIYQFEIVDLLSSLGWFSGGLILFFYGRRMKRRATRFQKYISVIGSRTAMPVGQLSSAMGMNQDKVEKDLRKMVENGYFGPEAYLDEGLDYLFLTSAAADHQMKKDREAKAAASVPKEVNEGYSGILRSIRRANDRIADPVLSEKIDRLEEITAQIFRVIEKDPEKKKQVGTFLNYYLPTTQKLLDSYAEFEETGVEGENMRQAKQRIENTMDTIVEGFANQLDSLYVSKTMDLDSDIRVMESMLRQETSSVEKDFGISMSGGSAREVDLGGMAAQKEEK